MADQAVVTPIAGSVQMDDDFELCPCKSGKPFLACHGGVNLTPDIPLAMAKSSVQVKLDLGCGQNLRDGFEGVDLLAPLAKHKVDLFKFPFPWEDNSVDELYSSHFVEHIPARDVEARDITINRPVICNPENDAQRAEWESRPETARMIASYDRYLGQDMLFAFFDECWRILKPGSTMTVIVPALQSLRAFQDPTHRRFIPAQLFHYLSKDVRKSMGLEHYRVSCDFSGTTIHTCDGSMNLLSAEAATRRFNESWNTIYDFHATLIAKK